LKKTENLRETAKAAVAQNPVFFRVKYLGAFGTAMGELRGLCNRIEIRGIGEGYHLEGLETAWAGHGITPGEAMRPGPNPALRHLVLRRGDRIPRCDIWP
jgi:hypothetical protein